MNRVHQEELQTDLTVIGSGIAGLSAAYFALQQGIQTVLVGDAGASAFAGGPLDLLSAFPGEDLRLWADPWKALEGLPDFCPDHPYTRLNPEEIDQALRSITDALAAQGLAYHGTNRYNSQLITAVGTPKWTFRVPQTMWPGVEAWLNKSPCLFVDFYGLKDVSGPWLGASLSAHWPGFRTERIAFPGTQDRSELFAGLLAQSLESERVREQLAAAVNPLLKEETCVAFPTLLGLYTSQDIVSELQDRLGVSVFEIPVPPPSVPGIRFHETMLSLLHNFDCLHKVSGKKISAGRFEAENGFVLTLDDEGLESRLVSQKVILATGRFLGGGLVSDPGRIREPLFDLPVVFSGLNQDWHRKDFFDPRGHPVNRAGLEVDGFFRPVDQRGDVVFEHLYAAGSILAHSDWMRMKCGAGVAMASAYKAVEALGTTQANPV